MIIAISVVAYLAGVVGCLVAAAADYRYETIRGVDEAWRSDQAVTRTLLSVLWPLALAGLAAERLFRLFVTAAGRLGERRASREDAAVEALKEEALALKKTRDLFDEGTDEWRMLDQLATHARTRYQESQT